MGSGKTSWAIQEMNEHPEESYIFVTPFLDEVERIKNSTNINVYDPQNKGNGKLDSLNNLLASGENIATTHSLFTKITSETKELIKQGNYILILDESLEVISPYQIKKGDIKLIFENNLAYKDESNFVIWNEEKIYSDYKYSMIQALALNKSLICIDDMFLWYFPVDTFNNFSKVYILTYMFNGQLMKYYFDINNLNYNFKSVKQKDKKYCLVDYNFLSEDREKFKELINICEDIKLNAVGEKNNALSKSWFDAQQKENSNMVNILNRNLSNYFKHKVDSKSQFIGWTTFKDYQNNLSAKGRKYIRQLTSEEKKNEIFVKQCSCFIPCNSRATNIYSERFNLAYAINIFINPCICKYFQHNGLIINQEKYALCEMLQWIWRSRIRNNQNINLYIPSKRMRHILMDWLDKKI